MRVFLTGATGFIGARIVPELLAAGHAVLGLTRSDAGARLLEAAGAEAYRGTLEDPAGLAAGAAQADAVIHTAFDHDFDNFIANCSKDARVIAAIGEALKGSDRPFLITSGVGMGSALPGALATEDAYVPDNPNPRVLSEQTGVALLDAGVNVSVVRLPQVHDPVKQGLVSPYVALSRKAGVVGYIGDGQNRWPAAHVRDVAKLYALALDANEAGARYHAVAEEGITAREIAEVVADGLGMPARALSLEVAQAHYGWLGMFLGMDMPASSDWTRERLGWQPTGPGMIADLRAMEYSAV
jgi:nucleoside-diphosphate-sugar epimerase